MLAARGYKYKKDLKDAIGTHFNHTEVSYFGEEYTPDGEMTVVGPSPTDRRWYATVTTRHGLITKVS